MATPMPDSKCERMTVSLHIVNGMVQCANMEVSSVSCDGLAMKATSPHNRLAKSILSKVCMSPSQPATIPSSLSNAKAKQLVVPQAYTMSKQRMVMASRRSSWQMRLMAR